MTQWHHHTSSCFGFLNPTQRGRVLHPASGFDHEEELPVPKIRKGTHGDISPKSVFSFLFSFYVGFKGKK